MHAITPKANKLIPCFIITFQRLPVITFHIIGHKHLNFLQTINVIKTNDFKIIFQV